MSTRDDNQSQHDWTPPAQATAAPTASGDARDEMIRLLRNQRDAYEQRIAELEIEKEKRIAPTDLSTAIMALQRYENYGNESGGGVQESNDGEYVLRDDVLAAIASQPSAVPQAASDEAVAVIGSGYQLLWTRQDWSKGLKVGDLLYTRPVAVPLQIPTWRERIKDDCFIDPARPGFALTGASAKLAALDAENADLRAAVPQAASLSREHIEAIQKLGRDDPSVHAFLQLQRRDNLAWHDVLAQMALHLAGEKAALHRMVVKQMSLTPPAPIEMARGLSAAVPQAVAVPEGWSMKMHEDGWIFFKRPDEMRATVTPGNELGSYGDTLYMLMSALAAIPTTPSGEA